MFLCLEYSLYEGVDIMTQILSVMNIIIYILYIICYATFPLMGANNGNCHLNAILRNAFE